MSTEKIIIREVDKTTPGGLAPTSSDVAFVIGFTANKEAPEVPTLCTTVGQFTANFGEEAAKITSVPAGITSIKEKDEDRSYYYAKELLTMGMSVVYLGLQGGDLSALYSDLSNKGSKLYKTLDLLNDKNEYSVKYLTLGGYPVITNAITKTEVKGEDGTVTEVDTYTSYATVLMNIAATRGDCVALIDREILDKGRTHTDAYDDFSIASVASTGSYAAAMWPWGTYNVNDTTMIMPASFGYLMCVAKSIKTQANWLAMAGVTRGLVPNLKSLHTSEPLTNTLAEKFQPRNPDTTARDPNYAINCITNIKPYGLCLWGNRTLAPIDPNGLTAANFLNTRNMVSDIKKLLYSTAKSLMFEQNTETLWVRFKGGMSPLLNQLKSGGGIVDFQMIRNTTKNKGELCATVRVYPVYAVEYFDLTVEISDQDVSVEG